MRNTFIVFAKLLGFLLLHSTFHTLAAFGQAIWGHLKWTGPDFARPWVWGYSADLLLSGPAPPTFDKCQEGLNKDIQAILQQVKALWDSLKH